MIDYPKPLLNSILIPSNIYKAEGSDTDVTKEFNLIISQFYFLCFMLVFLNNKQSGPPFNIQQSDTRSAP